MRGLPIEAPAQLLILPAHAICGDISVSNFSVVRSLALSPDGEPWDGLSVAMRPVAPAAADGRVGFGVGQGPASTTHPNMTMTDTDSDGISDGKEDQDLNGRVDSGEADPKKWDTDGDNLPDGKVDFDPGAGPDWRGEDLNVNGVRDKDAGANHLETDLLVVDTDTYGAQPAESFAEPTVLSKPVAFARQAPRRPSTRGQIRLLFPTQSARR